MPTIRTGLPILVELIDLVNSVKSQTNLTQMVNFPTCIPDCDSHSPTLLDLFISSNTGICSTIAFPPLRNSDHVVVSVFVDFTSNSWNVCFIAELMTILKLIWTVFVII